MLICAKYCSMWWGDSSEQNEVPASWNLEQIKEWRKVRDREWSSEQKPLWEAQFKLSGSSALENYFILLIHRAVK